MSREVQGAVLMVIGVVVGRSVLSGAHLSFVKSSLGAPLIASALVMIVLGALSLLRDREDELAAAPVGEHGPSIVAPGHTHGHGHDHGRAPRIGLLVLVPILTLVLVAPQPLGADAASRGGANRVAAPAFDLGPLPEPIDGAVTLSLGATVVRALADTDGPLLGTPVRLVGFVAGGQDAAGYRLSRFAMACCAADASVRQVLLVGGDESLPDDTWVEAVAVFDGQVHDPDGDGGAPGIPVLRVLRQDVVERPASPYEY